MRVAILPSREAAALAMTKGRARGYGLEKSFVELTADFSQQDQVNNQSFVPEKSGAPTGDPGIGVGVGDDHPADTGGQTPLRCTAESCRDGYMVPG